jgi:hypothetical protein
MSGRRLHLSIRANDREKLREPRETPVFNVEHKDSTYLGLGFH